MRVAFYAPMKPPDHPTPSGDRSMARLLQAALHHAGHTTELASSFRSYDRTGLQHRALAEQGHDEARQLIARWRGDATAPAAWLTYHLYHKAPDWLGPAVACALGIPYIVVEPSFAPKRSAGPFALGHAAAAKALGKADALLSLTRLDQAEVAKLAKPGALLELLPPFLDAGPFMRAADRRPALRAALAGRYGLDPAAVWLLAVGMMRAGDKLNSYTALGRALALLPPVPPGGAWQLLVVGDGTARPAVAAALGPRAVFAGEQPPDALPEFHAAADLCVWPAIGEAYGVALLEAQAAGLPVLAGRTRGVPDVVRDGETGVLVPLDDAAAFAAALQQLIADAPRRRRLGAAARAFVAAERDLPAAAVRLDRVLRALVR